MVYKFYIDGMKCENCKKTIETIINKFDSVEDLNIDIKTKEVVVSCDESDFQKLKEEIEKSGKYKVINGEDRYKLIPRESESKKKITNRMKRIIGQLNGIMNMIEEDRYCDDVLIQLSAVDKSIKSLANTILDEHLHTCVVENIKNDNLESLDEIIDLFKRFQ